MRAALCPFVPSFTASKNGGICDTGVGGTVLRMKGYVSETLNGTARIDPRYDFLTPVIGKVCKSCLNGSW